MEHKCKKTDLKTVEKCELKRDEIISAMNFCMSEGHICGKCPYRKVRFGISCRDKLIRDAISLIKELTEENESLGALNEHNDIVIEGKLERISALEKKVLKLTEENKELTRKLELANLEIECKERICESYMLQYGTVADKEVWLKKEREATIQKYREALYRAFAHFDSNDKFNKKVFLEAVDQIAKEMIGGTE